MLELLFVMAMTILGVVLAVLGVGMASGSGKKKAKEPSILEKGVRAAAQIYTVGKTLGDASDAEFLSKEQVETLANGYYAHEVISESTGHAIATLGTAAIGKEKFNSLATLYYVAGGKLPESYFDKDAMRQAAGLPPLKGRYGSSSLSSDEQDTLYKILVYAEDQGLDTDKLDVSLTTSLNNYTSRGTLTPVKDKHDRIKKYEIKIAKKMTSLEQRETGEHEIEHIINPSYNEAEINKSLLEKRMTDVRKNYGKLLAQLSYLDELSRRKDTYLDETGAIKKYSDIVDEFKAISPEGKSKLEDTAWQKAFVSYGISKKYAHIT